jgi:hypothetical protein
MSREKGRQVGSKNQKQGSVLGKDVGRISFILKEKLQFLCRSMQTFKFENEKCGSY